MSKKEQMRNHVRKFLSERGCKRIPDIAIDCGVALERRKKTKSPDKLLKMVLVWKEEKKISANMAKILSEYAILHICPHCGAELTGRINLEGDVAGGRWIAECKSCHQQFDVRIPKGRIVFAFTDPYDDDRHNPYESFDDDFTGEALTRVFGFKSIKGFMEFWSNLMWGSIGPFGMWQYTVDTSTGHTICCGAADPGDDEIYRDYFGNRRVMLYA